jgi:hypothetical protein
VAVGRAFALGLSGLLAATAASGSERVFLPTSIVCPVGQSGVLELISTSDAGVRELLKVSFTDGVAVLVEIEAAEVGNADFSPIFKQVPSANSGDDAEIARNAAAYAGRFLAEFCAAQDPEVRKQRWQQLQGVQP